jgi:hypothetical protein
VILVYISMSCDNIAQLHSRRVCEVQLHGDQTFDLRQQKYKVSEALKTGEVSVLFGLFFLFAHN